MADFSDILLLADYDRTLTDTRSRIPARNLEAIRAFTEAGGAFTVATGRSIPMFRARQAEIPYNVPLILCNGAASYDYRTGVLSEAVPLARGQALMRWLAREFPDLNLEIEEERCHYLIGEDPLRDAFYRENRTDCVHVTLDELPDRMLKISLLGSFRDTSVRQFFSGEKPAEIARFDEAARRIPEAFPEAAAERSAQRIIDIQSAAVTKGTAARRLARRLGRPLLVCVGDARNDLSMLREADLAFAPADCEQAVREAGIPVVCPCGEGAVADVIEILERRGNLLTKGS